MIGAIIGDIAGAPYEGDRLVQDKRDYRPFYLNGLAKFTDDTNLTIAVADSLLTGVPFEQKFIEWYKKNPDLGYGSSFKEWAGKGGGYQNESRGDGAAMRVSSIALFASKLGYSQSDTYWTPAECSFEEKWEWALRIAAESTKPTHNCPEARNGAMAVVTAGLLASMKLSKEKIKEIVINLSGYNLDASVEEIRETWTKRDIRCDIVVPQALICFLESKDFEDCIRLSVYSKGDVDTVAAIAGGIAEQFYGVDSINPGILVETKLRLKPDMIDIVNKCYEGQLNW